MTDADILDLWNRGRGTQFNEHILAFARALLADRWRPIAECSLKDGEWVLLFGKHSRGGCSMLTAKWDGYGWISGDDGYAPYLTPTHFQYLPQPPDTPT